MATPSTVDEYIAGFPPEVADRLHNIRGIIVAAVTASGGVPQENIRSGIEAVMLGGRYALHYSGWKKHMVMYPVPDLAEPLQS